MPTISDLGKAAKTKRPDLFPKTLSDKEAGLRAKQMAPGEYDDYSDTVTVSSHERRKPVPKPTTNGNGGTVGPGTASPPSQANQGIGGRVQAAAQTIAPSGMNPNQPLPGPAKGAPEMIGGALGAMLAPEVAGPRWLAQAIMAAGGGAAGHLAENPAATPMELAQAGGAQAAYTTGGNLAGGVLSGIGKGAVLGASRFVPEAAQTMLKEKIAATAGGFQKLMGRLGEQGRKVAAMVSRNPNTFDPVDILNGIGPTLATDVVGNQTGEAAARWNTYRQLARDFVDRHSPGGAVQPLDAAALQKLKSDAQDIADPIFKRIGSNNPPTVDENARASFYKAVADHAQQLLENTTPPAIIGGKAVSLADVNSETQQLIKLKALIAPLKNKAARFAAGPLGRAAAGAAVGAGVPGDRAHHALEGAAVGTLSSPQALSTIGLQLQNPLIAQAIASIGRAGGFVLGQ